MTSNRAPIVTTDGRPLVVSLDVADELTVLGNGDRTHVLDAVNARRLGEELIATADAIDSLQPDGPS